MDQEIVASVDFERIGRADEGGHRPLLDQQRAF
jgi:hypothetical protein